MAKRLAVVLKVFVIPRA